MQEEYLRSSFFKNLAAANSMLALIVGIGSFFILPNIMLSLFILILAVIWFIDFTWRELNAYLILKGTDLTINRSPWGKPRNVDLVKVKSFKKDKNTFILIMENSKKVRISLPEINKLSRDKFIKKIISIINFNNSRV